MAELPEPVSDLIRRFADNAEFYRATVYNEALCRIDFVNPMFEALGWDMANRAGYADAYRDVIHEDAIKIGGATKAPDYCFRIGGVRKFFLEAKKPSVSVKSDPEPAYQLRRYAWSAKLPLSVLTDFEEFAIYDCRIRPDKNDKASVGRVFYCTWQEYPIKWGQIASIFSREAILKGSFDRYAQSVRGKRGTAEVDAAFLAEIERWRDTLARTVALRNPDLSQRDLNFSVQRTIDRIIFLRICEDRGIEPYGQLQGLLNGEKVYARLNTVFRRADEKYNSGIFHFEHEKDRSEPPDELTPGLELDDKTLKDIIRGLYYPDSPYEFSVLPADILGQVYEQFLGKVIRLTAGHRAVVEEKPEVRKAGGVYYTPTYIVDYVVKHTVGRLLGDAPGAVQLNDGSKCEAASGPVLAPKEAAKLRILDPACGSGSFLIGAYQYLLDWHLRWYIQNNPEKWAKGKAPAIHSVARTDDSIRNPQSAVRNSGWRLTTAERKRILLNNIYGVDIDPQAVEVTKLSLLLKVLEGESGEVLNNQWRLLHERALPDLGRNIKCGNSLVGPDFYNGQQLEMFDEDERLRINVFDWQSEFPGPMKAGGFDAVIGNPPWGAQFGDDELAYLRTHYARVVARMVDSYIYFLDRALRLTRALAPIGFIIPSTLLNQIDAKPVRELLLNHGVFSLVNLGQGVFGRKVLNTSTIIITRSSADGTILVAEMSGVDRAARSEALADVVPKSLGTWMQAVRSDPHLTFFAGRVNGTSLLTRVRATHIPLAEVIDGAIHRGVSPDVAAAHVVTLREAKTLRLERDILKVSISGMQIRRYHSFHADQLIIYTTRQTRISDFPRALERLRRFRGQNTCREVAERKHPYWALHRPRDPGIFTPPKIIGITTSKRIELVLDDRLGLYVTDAMYLFRPVEGYNPLSIMAVMQSRAFLALYRVLNQGESRVIPQVKAAKLEQVPFPCAKPADTRYSRLGGLARQMLSLNASMESKRTAHEKQVLLRQIDSTDRMIDELVYQLYGLTEEEVVVVEEMTAPQAPG